MLRLEYQSRFSLIKVPVEEGEEGEGWDEKGKGGEGKRNYDDGAAGRFGCRDCGRLHYETGSWVDEERGDINRGG